MLLEAERTKTVFFKCLFIYALRGTMLSAVVCIRVITMCAFVIDDAKRLFRVSEGTLPFEASPGVEFYSL